MDALRHVRMMAEYNRWMNQRLYQAAATLSVAALTADRGAFFGSIAGTLNHLAVADSIWLRRFAAPGQWQHLRDADPWLPMPNGLQEALVEDFTSLRLLRERLDQLIVEWCAALKFNDLDRVLAYTNQRGEKRRSQLGPLLSHFFNHQTHHRGQATTLLVQAGVDPGATDLVAMPRFDPFSGRVEPSS
jgi:uncharacterized damage-inducible protein DinB